MNIFNLDRIAFEALHPIQNEPQNEAAKHATRNAALSLAHHLRAHGLSATVGYGLQSDEHIQKITRIYLNALNKACPIAGHDDVAKALSLKAETTATYLLHSRLALPLADGFALAAKAIWPTEDNTAPETAHV